VWHVEQEGAPLMASVNKAAPRVASPDGNESSEPALAPEQAADANNTMMPVKTMNCRIDPPM
jgi:hypothetical protein